MQGIQLYVNVVESSVFRRSLLVDSFAIDMAAETYVPGTSQLVNVAGTFQLASTVLRIGVECQPGFIGESCVPIDTCTTDSCSNNGICIQNDTGFTCVCMCDFTGDTCETRIDNCEGVDCNSGTTTTSASERSSAELAMGTVFGIFILITATIITILIILLLRQRRNEGPVSQGNVAYTGTSWGPVLCSGASLQGTNWG